MYDPWVVQTFESVHESIELSEANETSDNQVVRDPPPLPSETAQIDRALETAPSFGESSLISFECEALLLRLAPALSASMAVFYRYDQARDELVAHHLAGAQGHAIAGTSNRR